MAKSVIRWVGSNAGRRETISLNLSQRRLRSCLRGTTLLFEGLVQQHLYVGLIGKPLPMCEILSGLEIDHREPHGDGL